MRLSIILPIYNVAKFIPDCLDSLLCQDIPESDYEIICVDDGSFDNSVEVVKGYQETHRNIRLIHQENSGVCVARNNGIKAANGKYAWFIDPDDYILSNCIGTILDSLDGAQADLCDFLYGEVEEDAHFEKGDTEEIRFESQKGYSSMGSAWQYVFRKEYWEENGLSFNSSLAYGEDYLIAFQLNYRRHVGLSTQSKIYRYRQRKGSAMHTRSTEKRMRHMNDMHQLAIIYKEEYLRCQKEGLSKKVLKNIRLRQRLCVQSVITDLIQLAENKKEVKERLKVLKADKLYPYPIMFWQLSDKSLNINRKARWLALLFPIKSYVVFVNWLYRRKKGKKK